MQATVTHILRENAPRSNEVARVNSGKPKLLDQLREALRSRPMFYIKVDKECAVRSMDSENVLQSV